MATLKIGQRVELIEKKLLGKVAFIGETEFAAGKWVGVVLDEPRGKNNGSVKGKDYFSCPENCGIFVRQMQLRILLDDHRGSFSSITPSMASSGIRPPSVSSSTASLPSPSSGVEPPSSSSITSTQIKPPTTRQMSQSMIQSSPLHLSLDVSAYEAEIRDLKEKQDTLLLKRKEDREKLKEYEKLKIQIEQMLEFKRQMQNAQAELQNQLAAAKKEAKEAIEEKERHFEETRDLEEAAEMAALDKEMAEEKLEQATRELEDAKQKLEEVNLELEIIKEEIATKGSEGASTTYEFKQLEQKNEKLTEAVLRLRDMSNEDKAEMQKLTKELERAKRESSEYQKSKEKLTAEVQSLGSQIIDLKEQVDSALGAQEMVERLTDKNLQLEDELEKMADDRDVLEKLLETNEQLLETSKETEKDLIEERDMIHSRLREFVLEKDQMSSVVEDLKRTIERFRDERDKLNQEIGLLKSQKQESASEAQRVVAQEVEHNQENIEFKIRFHEKKAKDMETELKKCEEKYAKLQEDMANISDVVKGQNVVMEELRSRVEAKESEVHQLKKALKQKIEEASEAQIRKDMAEKKLQSSSKDLDDRSGRLQRELDDLKAYMTRKEKEYEETMTHLQSDIEDLEKERDKLRLKLSSGVKNASALDMSLGNVSLTSLSSPTRQFKPSFAASTPIMSVKESDDLYVAQIDVLRKTLSRVVRQKRDLQVEKALRDLQMKPMSDSRMAETKPLWLLRLQNRENEIDPKREKMHSLQNRIDDLQRRSRSLMMQESMLRSNISKRKDHILAKRDILIKYEDIRREVGDFVREYGADSLNQMSPMKTAATTDAVTARLRFPAKTCRETIRLNLTPEQLLRLHSNLL